MSIDIKSNKTKKKLAVALIILAVIFVAAFGIYYLLFGFSSPNEIVQSRSNRDALVHDLEATCVLGEEYALRELTPFEWDAVYFFGGYENRDEIYDTIGYRWAFLPAGESEERSIIVFVNDGRVVCYGRGGFDPIHISAGAQRPVLYSEDNPIVIVYGSDGNGNPFLAYRDGIYYWDAPW